MRIHASGLIYLIATGETDKRKIGKASGRSRSEKYQSSYNGHLGERAARLFAR